MAFANPPDLGGQQPHVPTVSCIVISWNRADSVMRCVRGLLASDYPADCLEVVVVDNNSGDGSSERIAQAFHGDDRVKVVRNPENVMTSGAVNAGINVAGGSWLFLLADDNRIDPGCIRELVDGAARNGAGIVSPKTYYGIGEDRRVFSYGVRVSLWGRPTRSPGAGDRDVGQFDGDSSVQCVHNALMVQRDLVERIGGFDCRNFPMQNEEADFCLRAHGAGARVYVVGRAVIWHDADPEAEIIGVGCRDFGLESQVRAFLTARNRTVLIRKHANHLQLLVYYVLAFPLLNVGYLAVMLATRRYRPNVKAYMKGMVRGVRDSIYREPSEPEWPLRVGDVRWRSLYGGRVNEVEMVCQWAGGTSPVGMAVAVSESTERQM